MLGNILDNDEDIDIARISRELGISSALFRGLLKSDVEFSSLSYKSLRSLALLLSMPLGLLYRELGLLEQDDFFEDKRDLEVIINELYEQMRHDDEFSAIAPTYQDWIKTPVATRVALVACYEKACGKLSRSSLIMALSDKDKEETR
ncbi:hypothetical protein [Acidihalobacter aeolianus]|uniref:hypothetical protein n=1 Tax=Acidihalobacter aeolianus TaxID=2792603 RepID=UPI0018D31828|nr:hypothetical protein [Acidihalobacter aeolianus]